MIRLQRPGKHSTFVNPFGIQLLLKIQRELDHSLSSAALNTQKRSLQARDKEGDSLGSILALIQRKRREAT